jgi:hypothetical protein
MARNPARNPVINATRVVVLLPERVPKTRIRYD